VQKSICCDIIAHLCFSCLSFITCVSLLTFTHLNKIIWCRHPGVGYICTTGEIIFNFEHKNHFIVILLLTCVSLYCKYASIYFLFILVVQMYPSSPWIFLPLNTGVGYLCVLYGKNVPHSSVWRLMMHII
jgi:hypothetical protein